MNARSRRQALLLINEHLGEEVHVAVELDIGFGYTGVLGGDGTLTQWRPPEVKRPPGPLSRVTSPRACTESAKPPCTSRSRDIRASLTRWPAREFMFGWPTTSA